MDKDQIFFAAGLTVAVAVGTFLLWGPSNVGRTRKKNAVIGLQNLGLTCYMNSLLQALASCQYFIEWLNSQKYKGQVADAVKNLLNILSGINEFNSDEAFVSPVEVVKALNQAGWPISNSQQDVHELLCNLIDMLEEETYRAYSDLNGSQDIPETTKSSNVSAAGDSENAISTHIIPNGFDLTDKRNTSHNDLNCLPLNNHLSKQELHKYPNGSLTPSNHVKKDCAPSCSSSSLINPSVITRKRRHGEIDTSHNRKPCPFIGYALNRIECTKCNYKSVLRYDKFDFITLHMPESKEVISSYTLSQLLENYVKHELINDIACEGCNENRDPAMPVITAPAIKLIRIGKEVSSAKTHPFGVCVTCEFSLSRW